MSGFCVADPGFTLQLSRASRCIPGESTTHGRKADSRRSGVAGMVAGTWRLAQRLHVARGGKRAATGLVLSFISSPADRYEDFACRHVESPFSGQKWDVLLTMSHPDSCGAFGVGSDQSLEPWRGCVPALGDYVIRCGLTFGPTPHGKLLVPSRVLEVQFS